MKVAGARGITRSRIPLIAMLALAATVGLAGCEGDRASDATGPAGPVGPVGPTGPTGPTVPPTVSIEDGGPVTVGNGSTLTTEQIEAIGGLVATLDSAAVTDNKAVIEFTVQTSHGGPVLGLAATTLRLGIAKLVAPSGGLPSRWQSYINRNATPGNTAAGFVPALASAIQANTESGTAAGWQEIGNGVYRYTSATNLSTVTSPIAVSYEPSLTHRVSFAIDLSGLARELAPDNPFWDFVPAGGAVTTSKLIAETKNCADCHVRFAEHGGPRRTTEYCVVCHNPGSVDPDGGESVDLAYMAHSIHQGEDRTSPYIVYGFNGTEYNYEDVKYPQPTLFCENCHTQSAAAPQGDDWQTNPSAASCGGCHDAGLGKTGPDAATGRYTYTYEHTAAVVAGTMFDDGTCGGCHRAAGPAGAILASHQKPVFASGNLNLRYGIERGREFEYEILDVTNAVAGQAPTVTFRIRDNGEAINVKSLTAADGQLTLALAWATRDFHNVKCISGVVDNPATPADETCVAGTLAGNRGRAITFDLIANMASVGDVGDGSYTYTLASPLPVGVNGDVMVTLYGRRQFADTSRAYPESEVFFPGTPRQALVSQAKCENCHEFVVGTTWHGGSRAGNPMSCTACHASSGGFSDEGFGPIAFGAFVHNLHAGKVEAIGAVRYPQSLARCEACHLEDTYYAARTDALPISTGPGAILQNVYDDTWDSATAGTCGTCHDSGPAKAHMQHNGGAFGVAGGKTLTPSSSTEACTVCHGEGRPQDTAKVHSGR